MRYFYLISCKYVVNVVRRHRFWGGMWPRARHDLRSNLLHIIFHSYRVGPICQTSYFPRHKYFHFIGSFIGMWFSFSLSGFSKSLSAYFEHFRFSSYSTVHTLSIHWRCERKKNWTHLERVTEFMAHNAVQQWIDACRHEVKNARHVGEDGVGASKYTAHWRTRRFPVDRHQSLCVEWCPA